MQGLWGISRCACWPREHGAGSWFDHVRITFCLCRVKGGITCRLKLRKSDEQDDVGRGHLHHVVHMFLLDGVHRSRTTPMCVSQLVADRPRCFKDWRIEWRKQAVVFANAYQFGTGIFVWSSFSPTSSNILSTLNPPKPSQPCWENPLSVFKIRHRTRSGTS